ncbi:hypothetical protein, partial [Eggerthella sp.]
MVVIYNSNAGYSAATNNRLSAAKGEYVGIVKSDDCILSETYETLYETADFKQFWSTERSRKFEFVALSKKKARYNTSPYLLSDISLLRADRLTSPESTEKHFCRNTTFGSTNHPVPPIKKTDSGSSFSLMQAQLTLSTPPCTSSGWTIPIPLSKTK